MNKRRAKKILRTVLYDSYEFRYKGAGYSDHELRKAIYYGKCVGILDSHLDKNPNCTISY